MVDGYNFSIDSTDPELLGKWMVEIFARTAPFTPATHCMVRAWPSYGRDLGERTEMDWIADTRYNGELYQIRSPRELLDALSVQLAQYELKG